MDNSIVSVKKFDKCEEHLILYIVNNKQNFLMDYSRVEGLPSLVLKMGE